MSPSPVTFDARPLSDPVDPVAVRAFDAELRARRSSGEQTRTVLGVVVLIVMMLVIIPVPVVLVMLGLREGSPSLTLIPLAIIVAAIAIAVFLIIQWRTNRITRYRLSRFARANGMTYEGSIQDPPLPGMIFSLGSRRKSTDLVRGTHPRFVEFANYQYTVKRNKNSSTYSWGYVAVRLDVPLPNIVLDATGNNGFGTNLPASFDTKQRLSLEGDFDEHFTLYCPEGYERDALYLFTPDIMARFIDHAGALDVEIVDDWMFLYTKRRVSTLDPATWAWLFGVVAALLTKFDQWARWRDERLAESRADAAGTGAPASAPTSPLPFAAPAGMLTPPPGVAPQGRRLRRATNWVSVVSVIAFAAFWFWMQSR